MLRSVVSLLHVAWIIALCIVFNNSVYGQCEFTIAHSNSNDQCLVAEEEVVWKNTTGVLVSGNTITKTLVSGSWDAGALSVNTVKDNGWMSTVVSGTNTDRIFGLASSPSATPGFGRSKFGVYLRSDGKFAVYEGTSLQGNPAGQYGDNSYRDGDVFYIKIERKVVKYYQNSTLLMQSTTAPTLPLTVEVTLNSWSPASTITQVKIGNGSDGTFTATASSPGTGAGYQWYLDGSMVGTGTTYTNTTLNSSNVLSCVLTTGTSGCKAAGSLVTSNTIRFQNVAVSTFADYNVLNNAVSYGCITATEPAAFASPVNVEFSGNTVTKTRGSNSTFDAGIFSANGVYNNGNIEGTIMQTGKAILFGLSAADAGVAMGSVDYAFLIRDDNGLEIYEKSVWHGSLGTYNANDKLKIEIDNGVVKYYWKGAIQYTSTVVPTSYPLYADASFAQINASIGSVTITNATAGSFSLRSTAIGSSPTYQWKLNGTDVGSGSSSYSNSSLTGGSTLVCQINTGLLGCSTVTTSNVTTSNTTFKGTAYITASSAVVSCAAMEEEATFTDMINVSASSNTARKVLGTNGFWDAGATSLNKVDDNGYAKFTATRNDIDRYFGLSSNAAAATHSSASNNTIQYAIYAASNSFYYVTESGTVRTSNAYSPGDIFKIKVDNGKVRYYKNSGSGDQLLWTSAVVPSLPLVVDISLNTKGAVSASVDNVLVSNGSNGVFTAVTANVGSAPVYQWKVGATDVGINSPTYSNNTLTSGDYVTCFITPDIAGCASNGFLSNKINVALLGGSSSPSTTWTGVSSSAWDNPLNWSNDVPKGYTKVTIPAGTTNSPVVNLSSSGVYDLTIDAGASLSISGSNTLYIFNKWESKGTFTANAATVNFKTCTNNRSTLIVGSAETFNNLTLDNNNGIDVSGEHHVKSQLSLGGIVDYVDAHTDLIVMEDNSTVSGVSNAAFVRGRLKKIGNDNFTFPIGKDGLWRPLSISAPSDAAHAFTAEYFKSSPVTAYGHSFDPSFYTISGCEYWTLERSGASDVKVSIGWNSASSCSGPPYITDASRLRVTSWDGSGWEDEGTDASLLTGDANDGTITSASTLTSYFAITLASTNAASALPITLTAFKASIIDDVVRVTWTTEMENNTHIFAVERADEFLHFEEIDSVKAAGNSTSAGQYSIIDHGPRVGKNYYRLKMIDLDKTINYSRIIMADMKEEGKLLIFPNPVKAGDMAFMTKRISRLIITDQFFRSIMVVEDSKTVDTSKLVPGMYYYADSETNQYQRLIVY